MKIIEVLKYISWDQNIKIIECGRDNTEEELFCGIVFDCPWWVGEMYFDEEDGSGSIYCNNEEDKAYITIYARENND